MAGDSHLVLGMATCNELNIIKDVIHGASLDEKKFSSTGWSMELEGEDQESAQLDQLSVPHMRSRSKDCVGQRQSSLTLIVFLKDMCQAGVQRWGSEEAT